MSNIKKPLYRMLQSVCIKAFVNTELTGPFEH